MLTLQALTLLYVLTSLRLNANGSEIINGKKVPDNQMLYMASVQSGNTHVCGGFLISKDFVVTAAHCSKPNPTSVVLGTHNLKKVDSKTMRYDVTQCKLVDFHNIVSGKDIMLLKLKKKAKLGKKVQLVKLPKTDMTMKANTECRVAGWGLTKTGGEAVDQLQMSNVSIVDPEECKKRLDGKLPNNVICAGGYKTKNGFCQGDSGGPLICQGVAIGVVSFNVGKNCDYPNWPNVYTDVSKYLPSIKKMLQTKKCSRVTGSMHGLNKLLHFCVLVCFAQTVGGSEIIDGEKAPEDSMQYMVSLQTRWGHECGGFLISEEFVVTAAHCRDHAALQHVRLGHHDLKEAKSVSIEYTCKFPAYWSVGHGDDIMLVKLAERAPLNSKTKTIPLPNSATNLKENQTCSVAGWGKTETHRYGVTELRVVSVSIIDPPICQEMWGNDLPRNIICAGGFGTKKGFCQGDSGGPLVCNGEAVGVVSFNKHANCDYPDVPNVYTDLSKYLPWIHNVLRENKCV
ncbi:transmembrane protease serine 12-like [Nothobranchius furzeri]|uniref:Transmembrane protease serine 12-like n=2 Tax=Nothobranchius furzeri TaxID=105023 RepID=A0A9D2XIW6_NOTFU|nr:transmembrane protease serine 12-like [Nothobranchius furzeri]